jgi:hypothetical protein
MTSAALLCAAVIAVASVRERSRRQRASFSSSDPRATFSRMTAGLDRRLKARRRIISRCSGFFSSPRLGWR